MARANPPVKSDHAYQDPPSVRFGDDDPRSFYFDWLIHDIETGMPAHMIDRDLRMLRELGYDVRLLPASAIPVTGPVSDFHAKRKAAGL